MSEIFVFVPFLIVLMAVAGFLWLIHWVLISRNPDLGNERKFTRQLILLGFSLLGALIIVFSLPIQNDSRNQLLGLIGILFSGIIAFSSSSIIGNLAAGILLRITTPFKTGDFIQIQEHMGRVSERGLFDTEIQTEARELIALPNIYCISNPVKTIRNSGTIISVSLSLGYDLDHKKIESLLLEAASRAGLEEPFVHIIELGDFSVNYRISGLLVEPKFLISSKSKLYGCVLDTLHENDVEIMSPAFMNQRKLDEQYRAIPQDRLDMEPEVENKPQMEDIAFDKAEKAKELEQEKQLLASELENNKSRHKASSNEQEKSQLNSKILEAEERLKVIDKVTEAVKENP